MRRFKQQRLNLRLRITAAISVVCITIVTFLGIGFYIASEQLEEALVEQLLGEELEFLIKRYTADPTYVHTPGSNLEYYVFQSDNPSQIPAYLKILKNGHHEIDIGNNLGERDVIIREVGSLRFAVIYNIGTYEKREQEFKRLIMLALFIVMMLAIGLGYLLSGFLTKQLNLLARRVENLVPGGAYESLQHNEQDQEVAMLAHAFDQYHKLFLDMLKREQEFTANVSHELRTPLTAICTSCELLMTETALSEKAGVRVSNIMHSVNSMREHIDALLLLARQQEIGEMEEFGVRECVEDILVPFREEIARKALGCEINIPIEATMYINRQALEIVLNNLLHNAIDYTESGFIKVNFVDGSLEVIDSGVGILPEHQLLVFTRSYRGENKVGGLGLGLDIVGRICKQMHWDISLSSAIGKGSTFRIFFNHRDFM